MIWCEPKESRRLPPARSGRLVESLVPVVGALVERGEGGVVRACPDPLVVRADRVVGGGRAEGARELRGRELQAAVGVDVEQAADVGVVDEIALAERDADREGDACDAVGVVANAEEGGAVARGEVLEVGGEGAAADARGAVGVAPGGTRSPRPNRARSSRRRSRGTRRPGPRRPAAPPRSSRSPADTRRGGT